MNFKKVFWGIILVLIGAVLVLKNLGIIHLSWWSFLTLWPLLLIFWGISVLPVKDTWKIVLSVVAVSGAFLLVTLFPVQKPWDSDWLTWSSDDDGKGEVTNQILEEKYDTTIHVANLKFESGAGEFTFSDDSMKLISFNHQGKNQAYSMEVMNRKDTADINLSMGNKNGKHIHSKGGGEVAVKLNPKPVWNFEVNVGAASVTMDLQKLHLNKFNFNGGVCDLDLTVGKPEKESFVEIKSGVSSITIRIPEEAACQIKASTAMSNKDWDGFTKTGEDTYTTSGFGTSSKKIFIDLEVALSSVEIVRY